MKRVVHCADALAWLSKQDTMHGCSMVSSLPDFSEFPSLSLEGWKNWFTVSASKILSACPDDGVSIFYQRDSKWSGTWIDKCYLIQKAAEQSGHELLWHKIVCRTPAGNITFGKPAYSHLLCFSKTIRVPLEKSTADIIPQAGNSTWARGMGIDVCIAICRFILMHTESKTVVNPFCGHGSVLAVANALGLDAVGIELSRKRAEKAQLLQACLLPPRFLKPE